MSEQQAEYITDALEMMGIAYGPDVGRPVEELVKFLRFE